MHLLRDLLIMLTTTLSMEAISWTLHKYLFHGPLWFIHKTHHNRTVHTKPELNDIFSLMFAIVSFYLICFGWFQSFSIHFSIGIGITLYGTLYFIIHDGFIHQRYSFLKITLSNNYFKQIQRAHQYHHTFPNKTPSEEYGLLFIIGKKYWQAILSNK